MQVFARVCLSLSVPLVLKELKFPLSSYNSRVLGGNKNLWILIENEDEQIVSSEDSPCTVYLSSNKSVEGIFNLDIEVKDGNCMESRYNGMILDQVGAICADSCSGILEIGRLQNKENQIMILLDRLLGIHFKGAPVNFEKEYDHPQCIPPKFHPWKDSLARYVDSQNTYPQISVFQYFQDEEFTVIYDGYPKAEYHLLLLPNDLQTFRNFSANDLNSSHRELLCRMRDRAHWIIYQLGQPLEHLKIGFHRIPSLNHLHLHIIVK
jgi:hypothetical protein